MASSDRESISVPRSDSPWSDTAYSALGDAQAAALRAMGLDKQTARTRGNRLTDDVRTPLEFAVGPADAEGTIRRVLRGDGDAIDWGMLGLTVAPPLIKKPLKVLGGKARQGLRVARRAIGLKKGGMAVQRPLKPVAPGNLGEEIRYRVRNPDGSVSTVRTMSIGTDKGETVIPTVIEGRVVSDDDAIKHYYDTGENFGTFGSVDDAEAYAQSLHERHARMLENERKAGNSSGW